MYFKPPRKPRLAVIYGRVGPDVPKPMTAALQESACRAFCAERSIPVSHSVLVSCGPEESLELLKSLVRRLPPEVDTLIAMRFFCYSTLLTELSSLCLVYQCRPTWLYSFDVVGPIQSAFHTVTAEDYELADQRYKALLEKY